MFILCFFSLSVLEMIDDGGEEVRCLNKNTRREDVLLLGELKPSFLNEFFQAKAKCGSLRISPEIQAEMEAEEEARKLAEKKV